MSWDPECSLYYKTCPQARQLRRGVSSRPNLPFPLPRSLTRNPAIDFQSLFPLPRLFQSVASEVKCKSFRKGVLGLGLLPCQRSAALWGGRCWLTPSHGAKRNCSSIRGTNQGWGWTGGTNTLQVAVPKGEGLHLAEGGWICRADGRGLCVIFSA